MHIVITDAWQKRPGTRPQPRILDPATPSLAVVCGNIVATFGRYCRLCVITALSVTCLGFTAVQIGPQCFGPSALFVGFPGLLSRGLVCPPRCRRLPACFRPYIRRCRSSISRRRIVCCCGTCACHRRCRLVLFFRHCCAKAPHFFADPMFTYHDRPCASNLPKG